MTKPIQPISRPWCVRPPEHQVCPPDACRCGCCQTIRPPQPDCRSYLLPRIIACGREWLRNCQACLPIEGLPTCAEPPFKLIAVHAVGEPSWLQQTDPARRLLCLHVTIPLLCQVEDCRGCMHCGRSCVEVDTTLHLPIHPSECWRNSLMVLPCVRLICAACPVETPAFQAQLEIHLESYMIRWEPCTSTLPKPECPPSLPLYPPPCTPTKMPTP